MTRLVALALAFFALGPAVISPTPATAGVLYFKSCTAFGNDASGTDSDGPAWASRGANGYALVNRCPEKGSLQISISSHVNYGANAQWHSNPPPTIGITGALTPLNQVLVSPAPSFDGFALSYFWDGGTQTVSDEGNCCGGMDYGVGVNRNDLNGSPYFGFQATCIAKGGCSLENNGQLLDVRGIQLTGQDNTPPVVLPPRDGPNLWYATSQWVRGTWPAEFVANDASGICAMSITAGSQSRAAPSYRVNQGSWTQCPTPRTLTDSVDTTAGPDGPLVLSVSASDAASPPNVAAPSETLYVDNSPVNLQLSGPTNALSTSGVQYVNATASAGPSGVSGIHCSVDGSPGASYAGSTAQIPVQGVGAHSVQCYAQNRAVGPDGTPGRSPVETWNLRIRLPTVSDITFGTRLLDALRCRHVTVRTRGAAHWVTIRRHGRRVRVRRRANLGRRHEVRCHPRVVVRVVRVDGRIKRRRILLLPHRVQISVKRVRFGRSVTVSGWAGLASGTALAGVPVRVLSAVDDRANRWRLSSVATTSADGVWTARLRPGPSRLIAAVYPGSDTTAPATSAALTLLTKTKVSLRIRPRITRWGHTIQISGRVAGGHIPPGKLLRLRIGTEGVHSTVGIPSIDRRGRYRTTWTFAPGRGTVRYWFSVSTLPEADYPYTQSASPRVHVIVR